MSRGRWAWVAAGPELSEAEPGWCEFQNSPGTEFVSGNDKVGATSMARYPELKNKVVLVTGGGSGIGAAIVRAFASQDAHVAFIDVCEEPARSLLAELRADGSTVHFEQCDLTDIAAMRRSVDGVRRFFGPIEFLVNNAASDDRHQTEEVTEAIWDRCLAVNLKQQFFCAQAVLPDMKVAQRGAIVNLGSISWMRGVGGMAGYTAAKSAILGLTRSLARDFGVFGIRVNAVAPGWVMTQRQIDKWLTPEAEEDMLRQQCLKRILQPIDIARFVVFLTSEDAAACTSQQYVIDCGWV